MRIVGINADMSDDTAEPRSEIECAEMISRGQLPSPSFWYGSELFAIRFTGLGAAYRSRNDEVAWREPSLWKSDAMLRRCVAVPVIVGHPETGILNSKEFAARMIGITIFSYVRDDAIWTIMRVLDHEAAEALVDEQAYDSSPSVLFASPTDSTMIELKDGTRLLVEATPVLIDHLAICEVGVWGIGRGDEPGVEVTSQLETEEV